MQCDDDDDWCLSQTSISIKSSSHFRWMCTPWRLTKGHTWTLISINIWQVWACKKATKVGLNSIHEWMEYTKIKNKNRKTPSADEDHEMCLKLQSHAQGWTFTLNLFCVCYRCAANLSWPAATPPYLHLPWTVFSQPEPGRAAHTRLSSPHPLSRSWGCRKGCCGSGWRYET